MFLYRPSSGQYYEKYPKIRCNTVQIHLVIWDHHMTYKVYIKLYKITEFGNTVDFNYVIFFCKRLKSDYYVFKICYYLITYYCVTCFGQSELSTLKIL